jgi:hypothetical protein
MARVVVDLRPVDGTQARVKASTCRVAFKSPPPGRAVELDERHNRCRISLALALAALAGLLTTWPMQLTLG